MTPRLSLYWLIFVENINDIIHSVKQESDDMQFFISIHYLHPFAKFAHHTRYFNSLMWIVGAIQSTSSTGASGQDAKSKPNVSVHLCHIKRVSFLMPVKEIDTYIGFSHFVYKTCNFKIVPKLIDFWWELVWQLINNTNESVNQEEEDVEVSVSIHNLHSFASVPHHTRYFDVQWWIIGASKNTSSTGARGQDAKSNPATYSCLNMQ